MRLRERRWTGRISRRSDPRAGASRIDQRPQISTNSKGWSLADSLRLLEHRYGADQDVLDLTVLEHSPEVRTPASSGPTPEALVEIAGVGRVTARLLFEHGFTEIQSVAVAQVSDLSRIPGFRSTRAEAVKAAAQALTSH